MCREGPILAHKRQETLFEALGRRLAEWREQDEDEENSSDGTLAETELPNGDRLNHKELTRFIKFVQVQTTKLFSILVVCIFWCRRSCLPASRPSRCRRPRPAPPALCPR